MEIRIACNGAMAMGQEITSCTMPFPEASMSSLRYLLTYHNVTVQGQGCKLSNRIL